MVKDNDFWELNDEDLSQGAVEDDECFGRYQELHSESCEMCGMKEECMAEMPSKFDQALETMGVDVG
jgi:hypothetical protein